MVTVGIGHGTVRIVIEISQENVRMGKVIIPRKLFRDMCKLGPRIFYWQLRFELGERGFHLRDDNNNIKPFRTYFENGDLVYEHIAIERKGHIYRPVYERS